MKIRLKYLYLAEGDGGKEGELDDLTSAFVYVKSTESYTTGLSIERVLPEWVEVYSSSGLIRVSFRDGDSAAYRWGRVRELAAVEGKINKHFSEKLFNERIREYKQTKPVFFTYDEVKARTLTQDKK